MWTDPGWFIYQLKVLPFLSIREKTLRQSRPRCRSGQSSNLKVSDTSSWTTNAKDVKREYVFPFTAS